MSIKETLRLLSDELGPFDRDEFRILEDALTKAQTNGYNDGWAAGYAEALADEETEFGMVRDW